MFVQSRKSGSQLQSDGFKKLNNSFFNEQRSLTTKDGEEHNYSFSMGIASIYNIFLGFIATFFGITLGVLSAVKRGSKIDYFSRTIALFGQALPQFWIALVLILVFSVYLKWLPAGLRGDSIWDIIYYILPTITLSSAALAGYLRITRSAMLEVMDSEYIRLARAKGATINKVIWKHAFRNALIQPLTVATMLLAGFLDGAVLVETVFAWPGMGSGVLTAVNNNDFALLQGYVFFFTVLFVFATFITDILYAFVDPRIRYE